MEFEYKRRNFAIEPTSNDDHIFKMIQKGKTFYERDLLEYMHKLIAKSTRGKVKSAAIDVGANIGNHSIYMQAFLTDYVVSVEPNEHVLPVLKRNLEKNIANYMVLEMALGEQEGAGAMDIPTDSKNLGQAKVVVDAAGSNVRISTLDSVVDELVVPRFGELDIKLVKIDVEGMELSVLRGARETLKKYKPHVFVEAFTEKEFAEISGFLAEENYQWLSQWGATPVHHFAFRPGWKDRFLARKAEWLIKRRKKRSRRALVVG